VGRRTLILSQHAFRRNCHASVLEQHAVIQWASAYQRDEIVPLSVSLHNPICTVPSKSDGVYPSQRAVDPQLLDPTAQYAEHTPVVDPTQMVPTEQSEYKEHVWPAPAVPKTILQKVYDLWRTVS
jgi:hypothetical protein